MKTKNKTGGEVASIKCPICNCERNWKDGLRETTIGLIQRYRCLDCNYRFSEKSYKQYSLTDGSQLCAVFEAKKLDSATEIKTVAGDAKPNSEADIIEFIWYMKKQGYKDSTIISRDARLKRLVKLDANLNDPESIKETIAKQGHWKESMKEVMVFAYDLFAKWKGLKWEKPRYKAVRELPFIPEEREIDDVTAGCGEEIALLLRIIKLSGARVGEIYNLRWKDIDFESKRLSIVAEKGSRPRLFNVPEKLLEAIKQQPTMNDRLFNRYKSLVNLRRTYERQRNRTAQKLRNPRLTRITFHTLRHWKGKTEYHKTKDLIHVQQTLGHVNIKNTMLYIQLAEVEENNEYISKVAKTPQEIMELIEQGFDFVCESDGLKFFKKPK